MASILVCTGVMGTRFQAKVRKSVYHLTKTFASRRDAEAWARRVEVAIETATPDRPFDRAAWLAAGPKGLRARAEDEGDPDEQDAPHPRWTLGRALRHYLATVTPTKKGAVQEERRINAWLAHPLAGRPLPEVGREDVKAHIKGRVEEKRKGMTIRNEVLLLSALYRHAVDEWGLTLVNPVRGGDLPDKGAKRKRRLQEGRGGEPSDEARLLAACEGRRHGEEMRDLIVLALETGMRQGEMLSLRAGQVQRQHGGATVVELVDTKNGDTRHVVLTGRALDVVDRRMEGKGAGERLFGLTAETVISRFRDFRDSAGLPHIRFHDLRHEAVSRMAGAGLTIGELANQSGHRSASVLMDYVNARTGDIARKLG